MYERGNICYPFFYLEEMRLGRVSGWKIVWQHYQFGGVNNMMVANQIFEMDEGGEGGCENFNKLNLVI